MSVPSNFYEEVVNITHEYFGPAADRFVNRQIRNHLHIQPEQLRQRDLANLIVWISLAMALLIDDQNLINEYVTNLKGMAATASTRK